MPNSTLVHVAVGVLVNCSDEVLISYRRPGSHQGALWEFPGGKVESDEGVRNALRREFAEELGIEVRACFPFTRIRHDYHDKSILLDVWRITDYRGEAAGLEGQAIEWRSIDKLAATDFPAANIPIIKLLKLPREIAITPAVQSVERMELVLEKLLEQRIRLIQFRQTHLLGGEYLNWFERANQMCKFRGVQLMFNQDRELFKRSGAAGYHANTVRLMQLQQRPVEQGLLFSAACHSLAELQWAETLQADFVTLSPVCHTDKYAPGAELGWNRFQELAGQVSLPVYALGGVKRGDWQQARRRGAVGISGISAFLA